MELGASSAAQSRQSWSQELLEAYSSVEELEHAGLVTVEEARALSGLGSRFRVRLPRSYAALFDNDPASRARCPIRIQALPQLAENDPALPGWAEELSMKAFGRLVPWHADPIGDLAKLAAPRLTHRYGNRAILHVSSSCAMYCRFCFRKSHLNDTERTLYDGDIEAALRYLKTHAEIRELILTGGDPLSMNDAWLERLFQRLAALSHLKTVRVHSRMAATLPSRLTAGLSAVFARDWPFGVSLVSHFNHPRELTADARAGLARLRRAGVTLYNQSVLLRGVNADVDTLSELFQSLYETGVTPFYLHHPDWTPGTFHFRLSVEEGRALVRSLRGRVSGPALPQYVLDLPGGGGKIPLEAASWARALESRAGDGLSGTLYEVRAPHTRATATPGAPQPSLYLDLFTTRA